MPGIPYIQIQEDDLTETRSLAAYGLILEEVKDDIRIALEKALRHVDPSTLSHYSNFREGQNLETVDLELRPSDSKKRKRHDRIRLKFSLIVSPEEDGQYLVDVPKLTSPRLSFFCYRLDELKDVATRELAAYFADHSLEDLLDYRYQRQEMLDEIEVSFTPLKPQREKKRKDEEADVFFWALKEAGVDLSARAREKKLLRAYRRDREVGEILNVLSGERNNCIILIGEPGSGKTAVVHETVRRIADENCPAPLKRRKVFYTSAGELIAGCCYIGDWQNRLKNVVDEVKKKRHILHIDDIVGLIEAGRWSKGDENMAQFLKPFILDGTLVIIGEVTPQRYGIGERKDPGFMSLFRTLKVEETSDEVTLSILGSTAAALEGEFGVRIQPGVCEAAIELTRRFQPYRAFPGKGVSFLEHVAAEAARIDSKEAKSRPLITRQNAVSTFARQTGLPEFILSDHLTLVPQAVDRFFEERIIGQRSAVDAMTDLVTVIKSGLNDPLKPLGSFFFVGPTGVGKTEMAKSLAEYLFGSRDRLLRFDMSEYAEPMNVAKLIGSPLGGEAGELTEHIRLQPFSVVLLDEFEKAHPAIFDVMLQVLGEGRLTDAGGRTADFRSSIIIMTSNLGSSPRDQRKPGLRIDDMKRSLDEHFREQVESFFRPEFVNRIDRVVVFSSLDSDAMSRIARRELGRLLEREGITRRNLLVEIDDDSVELLLKSGFSPAYGARPLKREIERRIIVPLARYLVTQKITASRLIQVSRSENEILLSSTPLSEARQKVKLASTPLADESSLKMDLAGLVEGFAGLRTRLQTWAGGDTVREMENEGKRLIAETRKRDFVPYGKEAQNLWTRIYHMERLLKRLSRLRERAEYLEEFAGLTRRQRDSRYQPDLSQSYAELLSDTDYLEIELLCAHLHESNHALMRIIPLGKGAAGHSSPRVSWLHMLLRMYLRWAHRKGYEIELFVPAGEYISWIKAQKLNVKSLVPDYKEEPLWAEMQSGDPGELLKRVESIELSTAAISFKGTNVLGFLKGESGTHKLLVRSDEREAGSPFYTAIVMIGALGEDTSAYEYLTDSSYNELIKASPEDWKSVKRENVPDIIRIYAPEGDRCVRDLRTEVRTSQVKQVLDGDLDRFLIAYLKAIKAEEAWEGAQEKGPG